MLHAAAGNQTLPACAVQGPWRQQALCLSAPPGSVSRWYRQPGKVHMCGSCRAEQATGVQSEVVQKPVRGVDKASLPVADWRRYHLQVLFVDRTDTVRARVAAGIFERIAEWNGWGRAMYPWAAGVQANDGAEADWSTTAALMSQAQLLGIRAKLFAAPAEQITAEDLDRHDIVVAMDSGVQEAILQLPEKRWSNWYAQHKVCLLSRFSRYAGDDILRTGGTALLQEKLSKMVADTLEESRAVVEITRPSLSDGATSWNSMVKTLVVCCGGLVQYLADCYPPDLPEYDPV